MTETERAVMKQALEALYSNNVDKQSWAKTALMKALSQPAAQGDSSHPATVESFIGQSAQADFDADTWTFKMQPGYIVGAGFYRISYIGLTAPAPAA